MKVAFLRSASDKYLEMTAKLLLGFAIATALFLSACDNNDDDMHQDEFEYHAHIHSPSADTKHVGDTIHIEIEFESHTGMTVHHVQVRIYNKSDLTEVYRKPEDAHVHESDGEYTFTDDFVLSEANGVSAHTDWVFEARVWGHDVGVGEEVETVEFHVHPQ